jgi:hypothetical protein
VPQRFLSFSGTKKFHRDFAIQFHHKIASRKFMGLHDHGAELRERARESGSTLPNFDFERIG